MQQRDTKPPQDPAKDAKADKVVDPRRVLLIRTGVRAGGPDPSLLK